MWVLGSSPHGNSSGLLSFQLSVFFLSFWGYGVSAVFLNTLNVSELLESFIYPYLLSVFTGEA
jgi:hypothetical protein